MVTITGLRSGKQYSIQMRNGILSGDHRMVSLLRKENLVDHGILGLPPDIESVGGYLKSECSLSHLAQFCFDTIMSIEDDWDDGSGKRIF